MSFTIPKQKCPHCGYVCDRTSDTFGETQGPGPGDVSVCLRCTEVAFFDEELKLRRPLPIELENLRRDGDLWQKIEKIRIAKRQITARSN